MLVVRRDEAHELDVLVRVERRHVLPRRRVRAHDLELLVDAIRLEQVVRHADAVRLHRVALAVVVVADVRVVVIAHLIVAWEGSGARAGREHREGNR